MHFPECPISVFITSREGDSFKEYKQEVKGDTMTCYIESRPGEEWQIELKLSWETGKGQPGDYAYRGGIHVDGRQVDLMIMDRDDTEDVCIGVRSRDAKSIRPFVFQTLAVGDSDDEEVQQLDEATVRGLGSIVVEFERGSYSAPGEWTAQDNCSIRSMDPLMVHEKMKKKTSEVTTLGDARECVPHEVIVDFIPSVPPQSLKFKFLYRSAALLEVEDIEVEADEEPIVPDEPVAPDEPIAPDELVVPIAAFVRDVWDPIAAQAEFNRLQDEMEAASAPAPVLPDIKGKGKRDGAGADAARKKIKLEGGAIVISDDDEDDEVVEIKEEPDYSGSKGKGKAVEGGSEGRGKRTKVVTTTTTTTYYN